jgi:hypothetical protein
VAAMIRWVNPALAQSWREAAADLGIEVQTCAAGDSIVVPQFGSTEGMLCGLRPTLEGQRELQQRAEASGMGWSVLGPSYLRYDRSLFVDTLNDWGWCAPGPPPAWYTGEPWTE